jgi:hypothetical protein
VYSGKKSLLYNDLFNYTNSTFQKHGYCYVMIRFLCAFSKLNCLICCCCRRRRHHHHHHHHHQIINQSHWKICQK